MKGLRSLIVSFVPLAALGGCMPQGETDRPAVSPAAQVVGEARSCIPLAQIRSTRVRDDWTIDFMGAGDRVWRNSLTSRCPGLSINDAITYETSLSQLCSNEIVYVLQTIGGTPQRGAGCHLGPFVPVELVRD